jgi:hypothetical protein
MAVNQYDPKAVTLTIVSPLPGVGSHTVSGYQEGTMMAAERRNNLNDLNVGSQGDSAFVLLRDKSGTITVSLQHTATSNAVFSKITTADNISGQGVFSVQLKDHNGNAIAGALVAKFEKDATLERGNEIVTNEWVMLCADLALTHGEYEAL